MTDVIQGEECATPGLEGMEDLFTCTGYWSRYLDEAITDVAQGVAFASLPLRLPHSGIREKEIARRAKGEKDNRRNGRGSWEGIRRTARYGLRLGIDDRIITVECLRLPTFTESA
jgi:hypothetical protein